MSFELVSLDNPGVVLSITSGSKLTLGRQARFKVETMAVSREHCTLVCPNEGSGQSIRVHARKTCYISGASHKKVCKVPSKQSKELSAGDVIYLSNEEGVLGNGFMLKHARRLSPSKSILSEKGRSHKQWNSQPWMEEEAPETPVRSKRIRLDTSPSLEAAPDEQAAPSGMFAGLRFLFWATGFASIMTTKAQKAGATVADELDPGVTHVIADKNTSAQQASAKLQASDMHSPVLKIEGEELVALPDRVHFVTPNWVSDCLAHAKLLPESSYLIDLARMDLLAKLQASGSPGEFEESGMDAEAAAVAKSGSPFKPRDRDSSDPTKGMDAEWKLWQETGLGFPVSQQIEESSQGHDTPLLRSPTFTAGYPGSPQVHERLRGAHASEVLQPISDVEGIREIELHTWDEPFEMQAAQDTVRRLYDHYHKQDLGKDKDGVSPGKSSGSFASTHGSATAGRSPHMSTPQSVPKARPKAERLQAKEDSEDDEHAGNKNTECSHVACSTKSFCIVRHLREIKGNYLRDREKFNKLTMDVIMARVEALQEPLRTTQDCERVRGNGVGSNNIDKLKEIVRTGAFRRNELLAKDLHHQTIKLFLTVWGTGERGAEAWWGQGCRTLKDLCSRDDLSAQQAAGLKYYDDLQHRIPRMEVAAIEAVVKEAVIDMLHCREAHDASTIFCYAVGSYIRGKADTGDVDMLILPPESAVELDSRLALHELLQILHKRGLLLDDMMSHKPPSEKGIGSATFLGMCRHKTSPCVRRIDLKWYPRRYMPFAVNHFVGSGTFNRTLRYWARTATDAAKAVNPKADGFKLGEYGLMPIRKVKVGRTGGRPRQDTEEEVGPAVDCKLESDIFRMLGLDYVPFRMRWWYNYE